ncbi:hypothetical protein LPA44_12085 [Halobacterium sp. KA-4]|uniref:hypothetical protein n=1 Tax=Halobacterium sp. KA-4 TaxID=2896367 RepID=UPI001E2DD3C9|nr:hypothetical protein [Halobacterium sp. KA-4]MCD2200632.1 hypothetical protein [Halobacterium sp. KA-4]
MPDEVIGAPGKTTIFNTIWLNERVKCDLSTELVEYLFLHEHGHASRSPTARLKFIVLTVSLASLTVGFICLTIAVGVIGVLDPIYSLVQGAIAVLIGIVFATLTGKGYLRVIRNEELHAELNVVHELGTEEFRRRHELFEETRDRGPIEVLQRRLFYPTMDMVVAASQDQ